MGSKISTAQDWTEINQGPGTYMEAARTWGGNVRINVNGERITLDKREAAAIAKFLTAYATS